MTRSDFLSVVALIVSFISAAGSWLSATTAFRSFNSHLDEIVKSNAQLDKEDWAKVIVFDIVDRESHSAKSIVGISLDKIRELYITEANAAEGVKVDVKDLQPIELKKILLSLVTTGQIYRTTDGKFMSSRAAFNPTAADSIVEMQLKYVILDTLTEQGGKHTVPEFFSELSKKVQDLKVESYNLIINELIASNAVLIDSKGLLYAAANPPPKPVNR